jgi:hypothetical protein
MSLNVAVPASPRGVGGLPPNGRHKALLIGINYHRSRAELRGGINDAKNMQMMLPNREEYHESIRMVHEGC